MTGLTSPAEGVFSFLEILGGYGCRPNQISATEKPKKRFRFIFHNRLKKINEFVLGTHPRFPSAAGGGLHELCKTNPLAEIE